MPAQRKPVAVTPRAQRDIEELVAQYVDEAGPDVASRCLNTLFEAFELLSRNPGLGSLSYATALNLPGARCWPLRPWPHLVFYVEREASMDVFRILHGARDIPATLADPDAEGPT